MRSRVVRRMAYYLGLLFQGLFEYMQFNVDFGQVVYLNLSFEDVLES